MIGKPRPFPSARERLPASAGISNFPRIAHSPIKQMSVPRGRINRRFLGSGFEDSDNRDHHGGNPLPKSDENPSVVNKINPDSLYTPSRENDKNSVATGTNSLHTASKGPFSARYHDPTIPPPETPKLLQKKLTCPPKWLEYNKETDNLAQIMKRLEALDESERIKVAVNFVERNEGSMWKFNQKFLYKGGEEIKEELCNDPNLASTLAKYSLVERKLKLGTSSDQYISCMDPYRLEATSHKSSIATRSSVNGLNHAKDNVEADPFIASVYTTREEKEERLKSLFAPALNQHGSAHHRGELHAYDWGNFSRYNGVLQRNEAAMLKR